ncbi:PAS domain S-box protein [Natronorarus salvus]|uniref:PAS domain S-box protein n=1 Tax=Natronorarus salvus TaxID=3117733 RepID=UPI002F25FE3D
MGASGLTDTLRETLAVFDGSGEPRTTPEVAERLDLGRRSTYARLERLVDHDRLETKKVGANARVWWRPPPERPSGDGDDPSVRSPTSIEVFASDPSAAAESLVADVIDDVGVGVFVLDEEFRVAWINRATERYFGFDREEVVGSDKRRLVEERVGPVVADGDAFADRVLATYDDNTYVECFECHVTAGEAREERWLEHRSKPIETGAFAGGRIELYYDVTERKRSERARRRDTERFGSLIDAVEEYAIFTLDTQGYVRSWNPGAERIKGYEVGEILGEHFSGFYTDDDRTAGVPEENLSEARAEGSVEDEGWRVRADGTRFWASVTITAIRDEDGALEGYAKVTRDTTDRREYEEEIRRERDFTRRLLETVPVGVLTVGTDGTIDTANRRAVELLELDRDADGTYTLGDVELTDEEGDPLAPDERPFVETIETGGSVRNRHFRLRSSNGCRRWLSTNAEPMVADGGEADRALLTVEDVSQRVEQAERLERQRDDLESELEEVLGRVTDAFYAVDDEWRFTHVNERAEELIDVEGSGLVGKDIWATFEWAAESRLREEYERAMVTQEPTSFDLFYPDPLDAWFEIHAYPGESGLSVYFRDITKRKERQLELERYAGIVDAVGEPVYEVDTAGRLVFVNEAFVEYSGYEESELLGRHVSIGMDEEAIDRVERRVAKLLANGGDGTTAVEYEVRTKGGDRIPVENRISLLTDDDGRIRGSAGMLWDVSDRKEAERAVLESEERLRLALEAAELGAWELDLRTGESPVRSPQHDRIFGYEEPLEDWSVDRFLEHVHPEDREAVERLFDDAFETGEWTFECRIVRADGEERWVEAHGEFEFDDGGEPIRAIGVVRDVTERKERERTLETQVHQQEVVADLGTAALEDADLDALMRDATRLVADTLDTEYCKVLDLDGDAGELLLRQGVGWNEGLVGEATVSAVEDDSQAAHTLAVEEPVVVEDLRTESRFSGPDLLRDHDVRSGISTIIGPAADPWGILGTHDTDPREFTDLDVSFVQSVTNVLASAIDRHEYERRLLSQREELAALDDLNSIVSEVTDTVIEQSTREKIEQAVCDALARTDAYEFAWLAEVDSATNTFRPRASARTRGYADRVVVSLDPDDPGNEGPGARAVRERETQVVRNVFSDPSFEPWREAAAEFGFTAVAAIPVVHEGTVYGVLGVYADRPDAFDTAERAVIDRLGEVVGHAIAAVERKRALMSDELIELDLRITDVLSALGSPVEMPGTMTLEYTIPLGDDEFLVYGTATPDAIDTVCGLVDTIPHWDAVTVRSRGDPTRFELRLTDPPLLSVVADHGGYIDSAVVEDGDYRVTIHLPPGVDVRRLLDGVEEAYPGTEMHRRRQLTRSGDDPHRIQRRLLRSLTDRQRAALDTAYHAGYFEWPREADGTEVADSLGVAPTTFHQHLRKAESKVVGSLYSSVTGSDG